MNQNVYALGAKAYGAARRTQSPLRVIVELYDAILCAISHAKAASLEGKPEAEFHAVEKASRILQTLDGVLNEDPKAQPVTDTLHEYYKTTIVQLHRAAQSKSPDSELRYGSVHRQVLKMRESFASIAGVPSIVARMTEKTA